MNRTITPRLFQKRHRKHLPEGAKIVQHEGRPHVLVKVPQGNGKRTAEQLCPLTRDAKGYWVAAGPWWGVWAGADGKAVEDSLSDNKAGAQQLLNERVAAVLAARTGKKADPCEAHAARPLATTSRTGRRCCGTGRVPPSTSPRRCRVSTRSWGHPAGRSWATSTRWACSVSWRGSRPTSRTRRPSGR